MGVNHHYDHLKIPHFFRVPAYNWSFSKSFCPYPHRVPHTNHCSPSLPPIIRFFTLFYPPWFFLYDPINEEQEKLPPSIFLHLGLPIFLTIIIVSSCYHLHCSVIHHSFYMSELAKNRKSFIFPVPSQPSLVAIFFCLPFIIYTIGYCPIAFFPSYRFWIYPSEIILKVDGL